MQSERVISSILVPYDYSTHAEKALSLAVELAEREGAWLLLLQVVPNREYPRAVVPPDMSVQQFGSHVRSQAETALQMTAARHATTRVRITTRVASGEPSSLVCQVAQEENMDLIMIGSHGRTNDPATLLGETASQVLRQVLCPVLIVRNETHSTLHMPSLHSDTYVG